MLSRQNKRPGKKSMHYIAEDGMLICNPRDKEAAHRAEVEAIATENKKLVTCKKCLTLLGRRSK